MCLPFFSFYGCNERAHKSPGSDQRATGAVDHFVDSWLWKPILRLCDHSDHSRSILYISVVNYGYERPFFQPCNGSNLYIQRNWMEWIVTSGVRNKSRNSGTFNSCFVLQSIWRTSRRTGVCGNSGHPRIDRSDWNSGCPGNSGSSLRRNRSNGSDISRRAVDIGNRGSRRNWSSARRGATSNRYQLLWKYKQHRQYIYKYNWRSNAWTHRYYFY